MLFSILVPVYNTGRYLNECVESILRQSEQDFEIILADDCSTDGSGQLCDVLAEQYASKIRVIHNEVNRGLLRTRRILFSEAFGEWVLCVDSDDLMEKNALEKIKKVIVSELPDMVIFNLKCFRMNGIIENFKPDLCANHLYGETEKPAVLKCFFQNNYLNSMCTKACRAAILDQEDDYLSYSLSIGEDAFQTYPLLDRAKKIYYLDEYLYNYRKNEGSMTVYKQYDYYDMFMPLWSRDKFYREKWNLPYDFYRAEDILRVKKIVHYLCERMEKFGYRWLKEKADMIREDGILAEAFQKSGIGGRYRIYCNAILSGHCLRFYFLGKAETMLLRMRRIKEK